MPIYSPLLPSAITILDIMDVNALLIQLTSAAPPTTHRALAKVAYRSHLLVARDDAGRIKGMATLCPIDKLTGMSGIIEDVVVDISLRGQHVGEGLVTRLMQFAKDVGMYQLELTSRHERIVANKLYQKLGFQIRATNCYRKIL